MQLTVNGILWTEEIRMHNLPSSDPFELKMAALNAVSKMSDLATTAAKKEGIKNRDLILLSLGKLDSILCILERLHMPEF